MKNSIYKHLAFCGLTIAIFSTPIYAGYLDFSGNWDYPSDVNMSKRKASSIASQCEAVSAYSNKAGDNSGAMIVAGPHTTETDKKLHLTVRLYKLGHHEKSCHVYINSKSQYASCNCNWM